MSLDPRLELLEPVGDPLTQRYEARFAGKAADVWIATPSTPMVVRAQMAALARADLPRVLRSPYLGRVLHGGTDEEGMPYLVIESVDAVTLSDRMCDGPAFKVSDAIRMVVDLLGGVAALSELGLHHGAVEPSHIRVIDASRGSTLRLFRLGANTRGARTGQIDPDEVTTAAALAYAAPEQARGDLGSDVSADAYSTVAVLYALVSGHLPFGGASADEVLSAAAYGSPRSVGEIRPELAGPLSETIDRALASDVTLRFASVAELQRALRGALLRSPALRNLETVVGTREGIVEASERRSSRAPEGGDSLGDDPLSDFGSEDRSTRERSRDEFGLDDAFDETFGPEESAESAEPDDRMADQDWADQGDDAPLELKPSQASEGTESEEEERTRVGQVSSDVLAALGSGEYPEPDYADYPDYADDEEDEPTRVGEVRQDLLAQTIREDDKPTVPPPAAPPEDLEQASAPALKPEATPWDTPDIDTPGIDTPDIDTPDTADTDTADTDTPDTDTADTDTAASQPSMPPSTAAAPRLSERPAGALPTAPDAPSALSTSSAPAPVEPTESRGTGWIWMLVGALVLAAAVAAGMLYGS
ncbi:MAG: serine/threonine protein kinase [Sandaracinaceae bacterium]